MVHYLERIEHPFNLKYSVHSFIRYNFILFKVYLHVIYFI